MMKVLLYHVFYRPQGYTKYILTERVEVNCSRPHPMRILQTVWTPIFTNSMQTTLVRAWTITISFNTCTTFLVGSWRSPLVDWGYDIVLFKLTCAEKVRCLYEMQCKLKYMISTQIIQTHNWFSRSLIIAVFSMRLSLYRGLSWCSLI